MAQFEQVGAPYSVAMTTPALTINDIMDGSFKFDPALNEHKNGKSRFIRVTIGDDDTRISFKTSDKAAIAGLIKGMEVGGVTITFKGTYTGVNAAGSLTQSAVEVSATISTMRVWEAVEVKNEADDKKPAEFEFTLRAAQKESDGSDPTITFSYAAAPEEG